MKHINKRDYKVGDVVLLMKSRNGMDQRTGQLFEVLEIRTSGSLRVKALEGKPTTVVFTLYVDSDEYKPATKEVRIEHYKHRVKILEEDISRIKGEIDFLEKYDSMEEFVADKIGLLIKADTKESRVEILKTLKQTNFI